MTKYVQENEALDQVVMSGHEMMAATTTAVRAISNDYETGVVFQGKGAFTDGKDVSLPVIPINAPVTKRDALVVGGYANHEGLHKLLTDFSGLRKKMEQWAQEGRALTKQLANGMEDGRIEHGGTVLYGGLSGAIDKTARDVNRKFIDEVYPQDPTIVEDFGKIGPVAITWESRKRIGYPDPSNEEALNLLPPDIRRKVKKIVDRLMKVPHGVTGMGKIDRRKTLAGSRKVAKMAEEIADEYMKKMQEEEEQKQQQRKQGQGQGGAETGQSQGEDKTANPDQPGEMGNPGDNQTTKPDEATKPNEETGQGLEPDEAKGEGGTGEQAGGWGATGQEEERQTLREPIPHDPSLQDAVKRTIDKITAQTDEPYTVMLPDRDKFHSRRALSELPEIKAHGKTWYAEQKKSISSEVGTTRRKMERLLTSMARTDVHNNKRSGKLDVRGNVSKIVNLKTNVFKKKMEEANVNSALSLLIDLSGSMNGEKIHLASQATLAIAEALDIVGVPFEVLGHHTVSYMRGLAKREKLTEVIRGRYGRRCSIIMKQFKDFDDPLSLCRSTLGAIERSVAGSNADGDAIIWAAKRLLERQEEKKFLFVLSDGKPAYYTDTRDEDQYTRDAIEWVRFRGVRVFGLGIKSNYVSKYYPDYVTCWDMERFAKVYVDQIVKLLMSNALPDQSSLMRTTVRRGKAI